MICALQFDAARGRPEDADEIFASEKILPAMRRRLG